MDKAVSPSQSLSLSQFLSVPFLGLFGEMCSFDIQLCSKETCQKDHWSDNEPQCQIIFIPSSYTNCHKYCHHTYSTLTQAEQFKYAFLLTKICFIQSIPFTKGPIPNTLKHTDIAEHIFILSMCFHTCVYVTELLNNTYLTRQSCDFKAQNMLREGGKRESE